MKCGQTKLKILLTNLKNITEQMVWSYQQALQCVSVCLCGGTVIV